MVTVILVLLIVILILFLINHYLPLTGEAKSIINIVVVVLAIVYVLWALGLLHR